MWLIIFVFAFLLRSWHLSSSTPFWVDEFSTASQALRILQAGPIIYFTRLHPELNNVLSNIIVAVSFWLNGTTEFAARIPFAIAGAIVPALLYYSTKKVFGQRIALSASLLTCCSYFLIVWSRQARGYSLQSLLVLGTIASYARLRNSRFTPRSLVTLFCFSLIGLLIHSAFIIVLVAMTIDMIYVNRTKLLSLSQRSYLYFLAGIALLLTVGAFKLGYISVFQDAIAKQLLHTNNLWYYHSFLWRTYGLITFLGLVGLLISYKRHESFVRPVIIYIILQLVFVCFIWPPYTSRYLVTIFPYLFLGTAVSIHTLIRARVIAVLTTLLIIANGNTFLLKPKPYYSINHDFREISNIDYDRVYAIIRTKGALDQGNTAVIDTWHDRLYWYLGQNFKHAYLFRWIRGSERVNGLPQLTIYETNSEGERYIPDRPSLRFVGELSDFKKVMKRYPKGFIFIDDASLPRDVLDYAQRNLNKELYLDHYPLDDNPYSIWPATLYSWGIQ